MGDRSRIVVGLGIDVNRPQVVPPELAAYAAWLSDSVGEAVDRTALLAAILRRYETTFDALADRPESIVAAWWERSALAGRRVRVSSTDGSVTHEGDVLSLGGDGSLRIRTASGDASITLGDVDVL